jgi:nucleoredoxin
MKTLLPTLVLSLALTLLCAAPSSAETLNELLDGKLVKITDDKIKKVPKGALANKKIFAFYYSAHWCPPCRAYTPGLSSEYAQLSAQHPELELIFVSSDRSEKDMEKYMAWGKMGYPAIDFKKVERLDQINRLGARGIPYLVVTDENGKELLGKGKEDWVHPSKILPQLKSLLQKGS